MHFTLATDESGDFERDGRDRLVVAGVLVSAHPNELDRDLRFHLRDWCSKNGVTFPPHATEVRRSKGTDGMISLLGVVGEAASIRSGFVVGVIDRARTGDDGIARTLRHARLLGDLADLAARIVATQTGADAARLAFCTASRSIPALTHGDADRARAVGLDVVSLQQGAVGKNETAKRIRGVHGALLRDALDGLRRADRGRLGPWPEIDQILVDSAENPSTNAGVIAADAICNALYNLEEHESSTALASLLTVPPDRVLVVHRDDLFGLRAMDRALRETVPDLVGAARWRGRLRGHARAPRPLRNRWRATCEGASRVADLLWTSAIDRLGNGLDAAGAELLAVTLHDAARLELDQKSGSYEGLWDALDSAWCGAHALARALRTHVERPDLAARLWRVCHETANHRGDHASATIARREFETSFRKRPSLSLYVERLAVDNLDVVRLQNRLPAEPEDVEAVMAELDDATSRLAETARTAASLAELAFPSETQDVPASRVAPKREADLRRALGLEPEVRSSLDGDVGRCVGTVARSHAFLGRWRAAIDTLLLARAHFGDSSFDLRFNATVLARMLCEMARTNVSLPGVDTHAALSLALELAGVDVHEPLEGRALAARCRATPAVRFALDVLLRAALWAPEVVPEQARHHLVDVFRRGARSDLHEVLSSGDCRSHPTELLARHAGELIRPIASEEARAWFDLSIALSDEAPAGSTLRAFAPFTRALAEGRAPIDAPPNTPMNPTFEYR